ncbi:DnaJ homolog subfamily B member 11 [Strongyloides ratti]|uniref:DnaJ homolog dnj-20 n=1 Tax=Strongyloides ratti TaxID=34506 RepID=A0A090MXB1_STRRB|nr:DnaJ homolog subfamily B member 11 [Strongyloides ratti]CEF65124.1 DnaJ homolog subfamily B member 11 [Strongyloides ratti]
MLFLHGKKILTIIIFLLIIIVDCGRDFYKILNVPRNANQNQIKKAYRKLAKELHPDRNQNDNQANEKFQDLGAAYEVLSDKKKRAIYDRHGEEGLKEMQGDSGGGFNPFKDFFGSGSPFKDFFGDGFSEEETEEVIHKGSDLNIDLWITLEEAYNGKILDIQRVKSYYKETSGTRKCNCRLEMRTKNMGGGAFQMFQVQVCDNCPNKEIVHEDIEYNIEIEKGVDEGHEILKHGEGEPHIDGESGDLVLRIKLEKHPIFERRGDNLYTNLTISLEQSLIGFQKEIVHMDGHKLEITRQQVTPPNSKIRKKGEGMPNISDNTKKGDLIVTIDVEFPKISLSTSEKEEISKILKQPSYDNKIYNGL